MPLLETLAQLNLFQIVLLVLGIIIASILIRIVLKTAFNIFKIGCVLVLAAAAVLFLMQFLN